MQKRYIPYQRLKIKDNTVECLKEGRRVNVRRCDYCGNRVGGGKKQVFCDFAVKYRTYRGRYV